MKKKIQNSSVEVLRWNVVIDVLGDETVTGVNDIYNHIERKRKRTLNTGKAYF
jgi:hypothetical protein